MNKKYLVGYDLGEEYSQISYISPGEHEATTLPMVPGTELYNIPTVLCKKIGSNQWYYGKEAIKRAEAGEGTLVNQLLSRAKAGEMIEVEGRMYSASALLTIFVKRSFSIFFQMTTARNVEALAITVDKIEDSFVPILEQVVQALGLQDSQVFIQNHEDSFYEYMVHQAKELWMEDVLLYDYKGGSLQRMNLVFNRKTTPVACMIHRKEIQNFPAREAGELSPSTKDMLDQRFEAEVSEGVSKGHIGSCFLVGEDFDGNWMHNSLRVLCDGGRRVFRGNNLYSKGAAYSAIDRLYPEQATKEYIFLGETKLKANVGMKVNKMGEESYLALLDAGKNWYDAKAECEIYLGKDHYVSLWITPLSPVATGLSPEKSQVHEERIALDELEVRPEGATRLRVKLHLENVSQMVVEIEDLGLGEIFPTKHQKWKSVINL